jgi:hypothetical protein
MSTFALLAGPTPPWLEGYGSLLQHPRSRSPFACLPGVPGAGLARTAPRTCPELYHDTWEHQPRVSRMSRARQQNLGLPRGKPLPSSSCAWHPRSECSWGGTRMLAWKQRASHWRIQHRLAPQRHWLQMKCSPGSMAGSPAATVEYSTCKQTT